MGKSTVPLSRIRNSIFILRGQKVMLDRDLAEIYGVETKRLNEQVKRNKSRFPTDFMFKLTKREKEEVVANCDHLYSIKFSASTPFAFTEHGAVMLASILNTPLAVKTSILVVRVFVQYRQLASSYEELAKKIDTLEKKYDANFNAVFNALRELITEHKPPRKQIGFTK